jgi:GAF domain-containing protein
MPPSTVRAMNADALGVRMAQLARSLSSEPGPEETLQLIVDSAVELVGPCTDASITLATKGGKVRAAATSSPQARRNDEIQDELREGPCIYAAWEEAVVSIPDVREEQRWPVWASRVTNELGFRSGVCVQLFTFEERMGALNLFSTAPHQFGVDEKQDAVALAAHAAVAMAAAHKVGNLNSAVINRTVIGQATGIVAAKYSLSSVQAFDVLRRLSNEQNRKLALVAGEVVTDWDASPGAAR